MVLPDKMSSPPFPPPKPTAHLFFRPPIPADIPRLVALANSPTISRWLMNSFPHPYTPADAAFWVARCNGPLSESMSVDWAVCLKGEPEGTGPAGDGEEGVFI